MVVAVPHCPASGVNVYVSVPTPTVLITEGDQVPVIGGALVEFNGNMPGVSF
jgi:transcription antitermination factor NusG